MAINWTNYALKKIQTIILSSFKPDSKEKNLQKFPYPLQIWKSETQSRKSNEISSQSAKQKGSVLVTMPKEEPKIQAAIADNNVYHFLNVYLMQCIILRILFFKIFFHLFRTSLNFSLVFKVQVLQIFAKFLPISHT